MKSNIDNLMKVHNLDAMLVSGPAQHNPPMFYFTGGVHVTHGDLIKKRGGEPVLFFNPMERDEAARTGLKTRALSDYDIKALLKESGDDLIEATAMRYKHMLVDLGITSGRLAVYGKLDAGAAYAVFAHLQSMMSNLEIIGESGLLEIYGATGQSMLMEAMETKDDEEVKRIRRMGEITVAVVDQTAKFLQSHQVKDDVLVKADGQPLTIGEVRAKIDMYVAGRGASNPYSVIFAIGRDAGVPHSPGNDDDQLTLGQTIVFDIFIQETGGGYFYDFTRTWCLGNAPEDVQNLYDDVRAVFDEIMSDVEANAPFAALQERTCDLFEERGHVSVKSDPDTQEGFVHGLGHGLGLNIHEMPSSRDPKSTLKPGVVVTIEPGLYYPARGMGCRLEDTIYIHPDGRIERLAEYPLDLVLKMGE